MRRPFRRTATIAATVLSVAALTAAAGCSSGSSSGGTPGTGASQAAAGPVKLTYWTWAPNMDKVVAIWNKAHPDITVTVNKQDGGDAAVTKLLTAIKAGSGAPDIMQAEYQKIPTLVSANALADHLRRRRRRRHRRLPEVDLERGDPGHRRGLRRPAGLRADDVLLPGRRAVQAGHRRPDHVGRVRGGGQEDPCRQLQAVPRHLQQRRPRLVRRAQPAGRGVLVVDQRQRLGRRTSTPRRPRRWPATGATWSSRA